MKSEHRHELAENDLAKVLSRWGTDFDKHANTILTVLIVATLIAAGIIYWTRTSAATSALGWTDLANASSAEDFQNVAEMYAGTSVVPWATLRAADGFLREGIRLSLTDRPASNERLSQAEESYEALLNNTGVPKEIREQALMGYAVTLETLSDGDTSAAIGAYEKLISEFEKTRFKQFAQDRIAELKTGGAQDFYAWFHRVNPKPADIPLPNDQAKSPGADILGSLPEIGEGDTSETMPFVVPENAADGAKKEDFNPFAKEEMKESPAGNASEKAPDAPAENKPESTDKPAETTPAADGQSGDTPQPPADPKPEKTPEETPAKETSESTPDETTETEKPDTPKPAETKADEKPDTDEPASDESADDVTEKPADDDAAEDATDSK